MIRLALKGWRWLAFPALFFWIFAVCLGVFAIKDGKSIYKQWTEPVTVTASVSGQMIDFSQIEGILDWTEVYVISGTLQIAGYAQECTITGIRSKFVEEEIKEGIVYAPESIMPHLLVNEAFLKGMKDEAGKLIEADQQVDWLSKSAELSFGENKTVVCDICGILKDQEENDTPILYMSAASAKALAQTMGEPEGVSQVRIKIANAGMFETVQRQLSKYGISAEDMDAELIWEQKLTVMRLKLLCVCSAATGVAAWVMFRQSLRMDAMRNKKEYEQLLDKGLSASAFHRRINRCRQFVFAASGAVIGWGICLCMPLFLAMLPLS